MTRYFYNVRFVFSDKGNYATHWIAVNGDDFLDAATKMEYFLRGYCLGCGHKGVITSVELTRPQSDDVYSLDDTRLATLRLRISQLQASAQGKREDQ